VFADAEFGVAWQAAGQNGPDIFFVRVDAQGNPIGSAANVTNADDDSVEAALAWGGADPIGYGLAWSDTRDGNGEIYFARLKQSGAVLDAQGIRVTSTASDSVHPSVAWNGSVWAIAWQDSAGGEPGIWLAHVSTSGVASKPVRIAGAAAPATAPSLAWSGKSYGAAWSDARDGAPAIYFATCAP
jgi:large repetitive protein